MALSRLAKSVALTPLAHRARSLAGENPSARKPNTADGLELVCLLCLATTLMRRGSCFPFLHIWPLEFEGIRLSCVFCFCHKYQVEDGFTGVLEEVMFFFIDLSRRRGTMMIIDFLT
jgi:hypothetical protein